MKIRSQTELQDFLDSSLATRKRELTTLRFMVLQSKRPHERDVLDIISIRNQQKDGVGWVYIPKAENLI